MGYSTINVPNSQVANSEKKAPPPWIFFNQAVFDGDWISFKNNAWPENGGSVVCRGNGPFVTSLDGNAVRRHFDRVEPNATAQQANRFTWCIRRCYLNTETQTWWITSYDLSQQNPISFDEPFVLLSPDANMCMGTDMPNKTGFTNNGDYRVKVVPLDFMKINKPCGALGIRLFSSAGCHDWIDFSTRVWYFKKKTPLQNSSVQYAQDLLVRNFYQIAKESDLMNRDGRNLTQANGHGDIVKLALHNDDSIDRSVWKVYPWQVHKNQVRRHFNAAPLAACRPGQGRHFLTSACENPPALPEGYHYDENGGVAQGSCPTGASRDSIGFCTDPSAAPTTNSGSVNWLYDRAAHATYLAQQAEERRLELERQERERVAAISCPVGTRKNPTSGECMAVDERANGGGGSVMARPVEPAGGCGPNRKFDPNRGQCVQDKTGIDPRNWFEWLWYKIFGYNFDELNPLQRIAIYAAVGIPVVLGAVVATETVAEDVAHDIV